MNLSAEELLAPGTKDFPVWNDGTAAKMQSAIQAAREAGDSVGGVIECAAVGLPAGLGEPMFDGMEKRIARIVFAIPAVKGLEFGAGFGAEAMRGSENNDAYYMDGDCVRTRTNHAGGILGGITSGMPLIFRAAVKPTPSIARMQHSISLSRKENAELEIQGTDPSRE